MIKLGVDVLNLKFYRKALLLFLIAFFAVASTVSNNALAQGGSHDGTRPIWWKDVRQDWFEIKDPQIRELAKASASMTWPGALLLDTNRNVYRYAKNPFKGVETGLCPNERFSDQFRSMRCSSTLVGPDLILTAGHCVVDIKNGVVKSAIEGSYIVFGNWVSEKNEPGPLMFAPNQVYKPIKVISGAYHRAFRVTNGEWKFAKDAQIETQISDDWALVKLDRPVDASIAKPVSLNPARKKIADGTTVFMLGFPSGFPLKYEWGAKVSFNDHSAYFTTDLSAFHGNSGSGVYNSSTLELVGILTSGDGDYQPVQYSTEPKKTCERVIVCPSEKCPVPKETVTRVERVRLP